MTQRATPELLSRRAALAALAMATTAPRLGIASHQRFVATHARRNRRAYDFSSPFDNVQAFVKVRGNLAPHLVYTYTSGRVYAVKQGEVAVPYLGYESGLIDRYDSAPDGVFLQTRRELMHFTDLTTGELANAVTNPVTQKRDEPIHGLVGPLQFAITPRGIAYNTRDPSQAPGNAFLLDWRVQGKDITVTQETLRRYRNSQQPDRWPMASTGEFRTYSDFLTYRLPLRDLENQQLAAPRVNIFYSGQTDWQPWMFMGSQTPGHMLWHATGFKSALRADLPARFVETTSRLHPGLLDDPFGYTEKSESYEDKLTAREQRRGAAP